MHDRRHNVHHSIWSAGVDVIANHHHGNGPLLSSMSKEEFGTF